MPIALPNNLESFGSTITSAIFGGNILANRGPMTGPGSYAEAVDALGVTNLRYPGGALTEFYFDIENPDAQVAYHAVTSEVSSFIPISQFMSFAEAHGHPVTIVIPTRFMLGDSTDAAGNRMPDIDQFALRNFVHDVASGVYGRAEIAGFEIGNEYWGSGNMNSVEYGRLAAEMAIIIDDELKVVAEEYAIDTEPMRVLVQMGHNYGTANLSSEYAGWSATDAIEDLAELYPEARLGPHTIRANDTVNWTAVNNELVIMGFDSAESREAIDGVIAHVYSKGSDTSRYFDLNTISRVWMNYEDFRDLEIHVTEWNLKTDSGPDRYTDYGLNQANEMLDLVETFAELGIDQAHVWPLFQNSANALSRGFEFSDPTPAGEMFSMISRNLVGKSMVDLTPSGDRETELETETADIHLFSGDDELVFYFVSTAPAEATTSVDISDLMQGFDSIEATVLGVAEGDATGSYASRATVEPRDAGEVYKDGVLTATLSSREIMQVVIRGVVPMQETGGVQQVEAYSSDLFTFPEADALPQVAQDQESEMPDDGDDGAPEDGGGGGGGAILMALAPFLMLLGMAG